MAVIVKEVGEKDGIAVRAVFILNETVGTALVKMNGRIVEPPHSRFREDGQQIQTPDDLDIPPTDYRRMFLIAGGILGKRRKKAHS